MTWQPPMAAILDLDGVVTRTERLHAAAWKQTFDAYLRHRSCESGAAFEPFDIETDYRLHVDGRPRHEGVRCFLASRKLALPLGLPTDPPDAATIHGLGNRKNAVFRQLLAQQGPDIVEASVNAIRILRRQGVKIALVSSSRNARSVIEAAGLTDLFDVVVDGEEAARLDLPGKPDPATFLEAAKRLGVRPADALVAEDAIAGVEAGRAGGFGRVIGIGTEATAELLRRHGADEVMMDLQPLVSARNDLPDANERFGDIARGLAGRRAAVFLDYDGTLTPIAPRPELAVLSEEMRDAVRALAGRCTVVVVSGRDRPDVEQLVGVAGLVYAGSHGFDIAGAGLRLEHPEAVPSRPRLGQAAERLQQALGGIEGVLIEPKQFAVAVHYRLADPARVPEVEAAVDEIAATIPGLRKTGGKKIFELRPDVRWDKGEAVLWLMTALKLDGPDVLPFYLGDDETDEDAFAALRERGVTVLVARSPRRTAAQYQLDSPAAVREFLHNLVASQPDRS